MIAGISHITFMVRDLDRSSHFWQEVFMAQEVYASGQKQFSLAREKFFLVGDLWLCLMEGDGPKERAYDHIAFKISPDDFDGYVEKIKGLGLSIRPERPRVQGEGRSVYFYDYDNHLLELHTGTLTERLKRYSGH